MLIGLNQYVILVLLNLIVKLINLILLVWSQLLNK